MDFCWNSIFVETEPANDREKHHMVLPVTGNIFDIKKYAIHDGPGIRTTVFFKGCPLFCQWCHNPEGLQMALQVIYDSQRCIGCHDCINACPESAISPTSAGMSTDSDRCKHCGICVEACPGTARQASGQTVTVPQLMETIQQDVLFYDESGGGVSFSGGEPLLQPDFLIEVLSACGRYDIHRVVDTSGYAGRAVIEKVARHTDLFLYDLKFMDSKRHEQYTGVSNKIILDNLKLLHDSGADIIIRIPLIPGVNDDGANLDQICSFLKPLEDIREIHVLPYHDFQKSKYSKLGLPYPAGDIVAPPQSRISNCVKRFEENGFQVILKG
jgi:pyruvate formate lyase activating enzyme